MVCRTVKRVRPMAVALHSVPSGLPFVQWELVRLRASYIRQKANLQISTEAIRANSPAKSKLRIEWHSRRVQLRQMSVSCLYVAYLITLSALASTLGGIVRPICLAAL